MAVIGKQLAQAFYGQAPVRNYWFGCSTGGRQGLMMAQRYPQDFDAIVAGAPAIHWDRFQAYQIWPQVVMNLDLGAPITSASDGGLPGGKLALATQKAIASCDAADGVTDGLIDDPRNCHYDPRTDASTTTAACTAQDATCLTPRKPGPSRDLGRRSCGDGAPPVARARARRRSDRHGRTDAVSHRHRAAAVLGIPRSDLGLAYAQPSELRGVLRQDGAGGGAADRDRQSGPVGLRGEGRQAAPHPTVARYTGGGSTDDAANFNCVAAQ
jgi:pimeloyl-ACP methyl ester carboxylesterase